MVEPGGGERLDLVVGPAALVSTAISVEADAVILEGRGGSRSLRRHGNEVERVLIRPRFERPAVFVPLDRPAGAAFALSHWVAADNAWRRSRNSLARSLVRFGALPEAGPVAVVGRRGRDSPYVLQAAMAQGGLPSADDAFLTLGQGDALSRNVFHVFGPTGRAPQWVVKFARVPGYATPFDREEVALGLVRDAGGATARHAPRLLGRFQVDGVSGSVETAAPGGRLRDVLRSRLSAGAKLALVDNVAGWLVEVGCSTAAPMQALSSERERLVKDVLPAWAANGVPKDLVARLPEVPAVLQHNDVGTWNVLVDRSDFTVVDWESARRHGLPLWDLVYFLTDALGVLSAAVTPLEQDDHARRLFLGELPYSQVLFRWLRIAVDELQLPPEAVGPIVTLGWLHHGLSHVSRGKALESKAPDHEAAWPAAERIAPFWLTVPGLGPSWERWRE